MRTKDFTPTTAEAQPFEDRLVRCKHAQRFTHLVCIETWCHTYLEGVTVDMRSTLGAPACCRCRKDSRGTQYRSLACIASLILLCTPSTIAAVSVAVQPVTDGSSGVSASSRTLKAFPTSSPTALGKLVEGRAKTLCASKHQGSCTCEDGSCFAYRRKDMLYVALLVCPVCSS